MPPEPVDETKEWLAGRYLSAGEGAWRILGYNITLKDPSCTSLPVHLDGSKSHRQYRQSNGSDANSLSLLQRYFNRPDDVFVTHDGHVRRFDSLTYMEYYTLFRVASYDITKAGHPNYFDERQLLGTRMHSIRRSPLHHHVTRIQAARPSEGERFYLRTILQSKPCTSFTDARTVDHVEYATYQEAACQLGLFTNESEAEMALLEGIQALRTPRQLRILFVHLLVNDCMAAPRAIWDTVQQSLSRDYILEHHGVEEIGVSYALRDMGRDLETFGKTLGEYALPEPGGIYSAEVEHELARWLPMAEVLGQQAHHAESHFNHDQRNIYYNIIDAVENGYQQLVFVDGQAGRGKTYLVNAVCDQLRSRGSIVLPTATAAYAAQLYRGGRTTHSAFKVSR